MARRDRIPRRAARAAGLLLYCALLAACGMAPGMRMETPVRLPAGGDPAAQAQEEVPLIPIDLALIQRLREAAPAVPQDMLLGLAGTPEPYTLGPGDVLHITVWDHPELSPASAVPSQGPGRQADPMSGFVVGEDGRLDFPYVGPMPVAGLRVDQVRARLYERLSAVFNRPQLTVRIASFRSKQVYVDGEVRSPGAQPINDIPMTLYEAVGRAGGFSPLADQSRMVLVRQGRSHLLDLPRMLARGENPARVVLQNGDWLKVVPREDNGVFVMGEVVKPVTAVPPPSGRLFLSDALLQAGSIDRASADATQLYVIRGTRDAAPQVFHLDARSPVAMILANQFELQPRDVVYVDGNGLVRLSRILSLLLPAINAGFYGTMVTK